MRPPYPYQERNPFDEMLQNVLGMLAIAVIVIGWAPAVWCFLCWMCRLVLALFDQGTVNV